MMGARDAPLRDFGSRRKPASAYQAFAAMFADLAPQERDELVDGVVAELPVLHVWHGQQLRKQVGNLLADGCPPDQIGYSAFAGPYAIPPLPDPPAVECEDLPPIESYAQPGDSPTPRQEPDTPRYTVVMVGDVLARPAPPERVRGVLPCEGIAAIYGPSKSGKSFLGLDLLDATTTGRDWFGHRVARCQGLYVCLEGAAGITKRAQALRVKRPGALRNVGFLFPPAFDLRSRKDREDFREAAESAGWRRSGILVIDTLSCACPGFDENDSAGMGAAVAGAKALQAALGGLVVLLHHTGKDRTKGLRGHSNLGAALDAAIEVSRDGDDRQWSVDKYKDGEEGAAFCFRLESVQIGSDSEDGEPITSCVVAPVEATTGTPSRSKPPQGGNQRIAYDALSELLRDSRDFGKGNAPPTRPCVSYTAAVATTARRLPVEAKRQPERAKAAITALVGNGCLAFANDWLWLP
ncbi:MAG: AAA family ATPase [Candidatus Accumulibacter similis]|nr:MAG: AAA family ATPase [Candidatus Accumulibacter similis]